MKTAKLAKAMEQYSCTLCMMVVQLNPIKILYKLSQDVAGNIS